MLRGGSLHLVKRTPKLIAKLARFEVMRGLGNGHVHLNKGAAIADIVPKLDPDICARCTARIFNECPPTPLAGPFGPEKGITALDSGAR